MSHFRPTRKSSLCSLRKNCTSFLTDHQHHSRTSKLLHLLSRTLTHQTHLQPHLFPTVDVPDHAHHIRSVILCVGLTGLLGDALVICVFCRSHTAVSKHPAVINLVVADFLVSLTQSPVFFVASLHHRWVLGELAFCGALFSITSMKDRCLAITRPLTLRGGVSRCWMQLVLAGVWMHALGWSRPPFFGWSAYVPEGLRTSCSWDYMSFTAAVRAYTILLFTFVLFLPLSLIPGCYFAIFQAVLKAGREAEQLNCGEANKAYERLRSEWRLARVALGVILLFIISWTPYSVAAGEATSLALQLKRHFVSSNYAYQSVTANTTDNSTSAPYSQQRGQTGLMANEASAAGLDYNSPDGGAGAEGNPLLPL